MIRRVSLVIALTLSFLMMFGSIARAEEIKAPASVSVSESAELQVVLKVPSVKANQIFSSLPQEKASDWVLEEGELTLKLEEKESIANVCITCPVTGIIGQCIPTLKVRMQDKNVRIVTDSCGFCQRCGS